MQYQDLINACRQDWQQYTEHLFVQQLAQATLAQPCFLHYLKQDFLFLKQYARAYALAIYKARTLHDVTYCAQWGLTESDLEHEPEDVGTIAYTRYVLDAGMSGDLLDLYTALAPCSIGYATIGKMLINDKNTVIAGNPYASWITLYGGAEFQSGVEKGTQHFNQLLAEIDLNSQRGQNLIEVFKTATRMEVAFWQQGLNAKQGE